MKSPWKWTATLEPDRDYLVLASTIPPLSRRSAWKMFEGSRLVRAQLAATDGVMGFAMLARPVQNQYATLSVWRDEEALAGFTRADPHRDLMKGLEPEMGETRFVRWTIRGADGRPSWDEALQRLG